VIKRGSARFLRQAGVYLVAAAGLVWVFHDVDWAKVGAGIAGLNWGWVAVAVLLDLAGYAAQGVRWSLLLRPLGRVSGPRATTAVFAGLFVNEVVPFHLGEIARALPISRWLALPFVAIVPSMALERLFDGIWMAVGLGLTALYVPLPRNLIEAGDLFGLAIIVLTAVLVFILVRRSRQGGEARPGQTGRGAWPARIAGTLRSLADGLRSIGLSRLSAGAFALSFLLVLLQAVSLWLLLRAYGLPLSFWVGAAVFLIIRFGTVLPGAPGNLGLYQLSCAFGLTLFGVEKTAAAGFSIVAFVLLSVPLWVLGALAFGRTGLTLATVKAKFDQQGASP
jgi:uncharacterized protein (TIRG00374 family)